MKTAGTAGQAGAGLEMAGSAVIFLRNEYAFKKCLRILFQRQGWFINVWKIINRKISLPKLEIRFCAERVLVVFFERGKPVGTLLGRVKDFSKVVIIMDGYIDEADKAELSAFGKSLSDMGKELGIINDPVFSIKFSYFNPCVDADEIIKEFCKGLENVLDSSPTLPIFERQPQIGWRNWQ